MSVSSEQAVLPAHRDLKWAYSSAQVGSSHSSVSVSSGGRPAGRIRVRSRKVDGPHLHRDSICAEPFSPRMSQVKWLRHMSSVISISRRGTKLSSTRTKCTGARFSKHREETTSKPTGRAPNQECDVSSRCEQRTPRRRGKTAGEER